MSPTSRRLFLTRLMLGSGTFAAGWWLGQRTGAQPQALSLTARVPAGEQPRMEALARTLGVDLSTARWVPAVDDAPADLVMVRQGRILDPVEWPHEALAVRARWIGHASAVTLTTTVDEPIARLARVVAADGGVSTIDLAYDRELVIQGRDGRRLVLGVQDGRAAVIESRCRHQHCVRQGAVAHAGERIVCAPAGLLVQLEA